MTRRAAFSVVGLVVAALVGVALLAVPGSPLQQKPTLGLDLQGGLEVTLQAVPPRDRKLTKEDLSRSVQIMRNRVDKLGVSEPEIRTQGNDQIAIQLPGVKDPAAAAAIIGKTAQLELFDLEKNLVAPSVDARTKQPIATPKLYDLLAGQQSLATKGSPESYYVFRTKGKQLVRGPVQTRRAALAKWGGKLPNGHKLLAVPPQTVVVHCGPNDVVCPGVGESPPTRNYWYLLRYTPPTVPEMTGKDLKLSGTRQDFDTQTGEPIVLMDFTGKGQDTFQKITRDIAIRGKLLFNTVGGGQGDYRNFLQHFAIVLDREIKSWPSIDFEQYPGGIAGSNGAQISGLASIGEAKDLALVLQTGALPVEFRTLDQTAISATLGRDSLQQAKKAALVGLIAVALFLLIFYRFLGVVAVMGLGVYAAFLYAAILLFNVTLTLPGIAGLVLTLGVAADANIVIFERIKEEVRAGRSVRAAIHTGYTKGFAHDRRRERRHRDHRDGAVRSRDRERARLRADAARRYRDLDAHRGARDPRVPRGARRPADARQPAPDGRRRRRHPTLAEARLHRQAATLVRDLRCRRRDLRRRDRGRGAQPRDRLQGRHPDRVRDAAARPARPGARAGGEDRPGECGHPGSRLLGGRRRTGASRCGPSRSRPTRSRRSSPT